MWNGYPVVRGMVAYSIMYPGANILQQVVFRNSHDDNKENKNRNNLLIKLQKVDWLEASRFMIYGALFHAPLVYNWMRLAGNVFPGTANKQILKKVNMHDIVQTSSKPPYQLI